MTEAPPRRFQDVNDYSVALATAQGGCGRGSPQSRRPADAEFRWNVRAVVLGKRFRSGGESIAPQRCSGSN